MSRDEDFSDLQVRDATGNFKSSTSWRRKPFDEKIKLKKPFLKIKFQNPNPEKVLSTDFIEHKNSYIKKHIKKKITCTRNRYKPLLTKAFNENNLTKKK